MSDSMSLPAGVPFPERDAETAARSKQRTGERAEAPLLDRIRGHADLARLDIEQLERLAEEIRRRMVDVVCRTGGHLGSNFGVVELTLALHRVFDFSRDRLVLDVGHQCYPHKLVTGRNVRFETLRTRGGLSGYPHPEESPHDVMRSGHAGTSISVGLGIAAGDGLAGRDRRVVCVIGDSSLGAGVALEALNYAAHVGRDVLVVLNDNEMSISRTVGALAGYLNRIRSNPLYATAKERFHQLLRSMPFGERIDRNLIDVIDAVKAAIAPGHLFEELGFRYFGPIDGHDLAGLVEQLGNVKDVPGVKLLHVVTKKGKGLEPTGKDTRFLHAVSAGERLPGFDTADGLDPEAERKPKATAKSFTRAFSDALIELAERDDRVVAITAAMPEGTGLDRFGERFPDRFHDVGICEQHAVAFAGGLALSGARPVCAIYSTFLQRGFDQVFQEAILQDLPIVFAMDRGGLVGQDGPSHHGVFDIAYLRAFPRAVLGSPRDESELRRMLELAIEQEHPFFLRYPRGACPSPEAASSVPMEVGRGELLREGDDVALVGYGPMTYTLLEAAEELAERGISAAVADARFAKPLDADLLLDLAGRTRLLVTLEEHQRHGGFGSAVLELFAERGGPAHRVVPMGIPDRLIEHASREECLADAGLTAGDVVRTVLARLERSAARR